MTAPRRLWPVLALAALQAAGCNCDPLAQNGTAVRVRVDIAPEVTVTQLRFSVTHDGGALFDPVVRPDVEGARLESGGSLLVLADDALAGQSVECDVDGLASGKPVTSGQGNAVVVRGREVPCPVSLIQPTGCGPGSCAGCCVNGACADGEEDGACGSSGASCFACDEGQRCVAGGCTCDVTSCDGCCSGNVCVDGGSPLACGRGGIQCASCASAQTCDEGVCGCDGGACAMGCSPGSCPSGCCSGDKCLGSGVASCGHGGTLCVDCRTNLSDSCAANGTCACGNTGAACPSTQHCVGGQCICDGTVCPSGCCTAGTCLTRGPGSCGNNGSACMDCRTLLSDSCLANGNCGCGTNGPCNAGQHCVGGQCVCDGTGCAGGCCQGTNCYSMGGKQHCGNDGGTCKSCNGAMQCTNGTCQ
jgi:hypothetical protein